MTVLRRASERRANEVVLCGGIASLAATLVVYAVPRGGDLAAHLYRTSLVQHGVLVWDNLWFTGQYPLSSYSLLYYLLASVVGNAVLGIAGVAIAAAIFAAVAQREWKSIGRWPARAFAVLVTGQAFTAAYPYDLGLATLVATLWALQRRRTWIAVCCTILTLGFSPLAFLFLTLALLALLVRRRRPNLQMLAVGAAVALSGGVQLAVLFLLPAPGLVYPYGGWRLAAGLAVAALGIALSLHGRGGRPLASIFAVWASASIVADVVPSPVGHNLVRASVFVVPLMLVAAALSDFRPRWLALTAVAAAFAGNVLPYAAMITVRSSAAGSKASFWQPIVRFLGNHSGPAFRVEVVPTANHWEAYYLPAAGLPLARGWYRQLDIADDPALYARHLTGASYRLWLRHHGVRYVVLPHLPLEAVDAARESTLLRSGSAGLDEVWSSPQATIYALPHPTPILTGAGTPTITKLTSSRIDGSVSRGGTYLLRVRYTPYLRVTGGPVCLAPDGTMTSLTAPRATRFDLSAVETPGGVLTTLFDGDRARCAAAPRAGRALRLSADGSASRGFRMSRR
jgi:hypothetical protein